MAEVLWRTYQDPDAPALADLMNAIEEYGGGRPSYTAAELRSLIATLVRDLGEDSTVVYAPDGELVAAGFTTTPPDGGHRLYLTGGVHPRWRGRGIGRRILGRHVARAVQIHRAVAPDVPWTAEAPRLPAGDEDAARLLRRAGLTPARYWFEMVASTTQPSAAAGPPGLEVVPYSPRHEAAVHAAHMESFAGNWAFQYRELASWLAITVRSRSFLPGLSLLAFCGLELAGYLLTYQHAGPGRVYVGELGVRPPWRRRGLAGALLSGVLAAAGRAGHNEVTLSVDAASATGAVGVYERAGFTIESSTVSYSMPLTG